MDNALLYSKLLTLPELMKSEVSDFINFLLTKGRKENIHENKPKPKLVAEKACSK